MSPSFVLDCSVTMTWCFEDEPSIYADAVLRSLKHSKALVPSLWRLEVANFLLIAERKKRIKEAGMINFANLLNQLPIQVSEAPFNLIDFVYLGRMHQLTSYDACYLGLALENGLPIATLDEKMKQAATTAGVSLYSPESVLKRGKKVS